MFCYDRVQFELFDYHNTMKNGSISELLNQQEQELQSYERKTKINQDRNKENLFSKNHKTIIHQFINPSCFIRSG